MPTVTAKAALLSSAATLDQPPRTPQEESDHLWRRWRIKRSVKRLAQLRATGGGPPFMRDGCVVRYVPGLDDEWAVAQLGEPMHSTTEESARKLLERRADDVPALT